VRADGYAELGCQQEDRHVLVDAADPARVDLEHRHAAGLQELLEHDAVLHVLAGCHPDRGHRPGRGRLGQESSDRKARDPGGEIPAGVDHAADGHVHDAFSGPSHVLAVPEKVTLLASNRLFLLASRAAITVLVKLPVVVEYFGYGRGGGLPGERLTWPVAGFAHLLMDSRGQGDQSGCGGDTPDVRAEGGGGPGLVTRGISSPDNSYYRRLITDAVRAVDAARALDGVDGEWVIVTGNSQGGGLALAVAGLVGDLAAVLANVPFLCHIQRAIDLTDEAPYGEIVRYLAVHRGAEEAVRRTLAYVDTVNFARS
jgi:hypothetical protein